MSSKFKHYPAKPENAACKKAFDVLCSAHGASTSFFSLFESLRSGRHARGTPTDQEQDLLRAMLVFSSSGLDYVVKQLVKEALPQVVDKHEGSNKMLQRYIEKCLVQGEKINIAYTASILGSRDPRAALVNGWLRELTDGSLQSVDELLKIGSCFDIPSSILIGNIRDMKAVFEVRNQISHEMDVDFDQTNRSRKPRRRDDMVRYTDEIFQVAKNFLEAVDQKLR